MVDMRKYTSGLITPDEVRDGPIEARIISVYISEKHNVPVLELETGDQFFVWPQNGKKLARAYGYNSDDWLRHLIRFELGNLHRQEDWRGKGNRQPHTDLVARRQRRQWHAAARRSGQAASAGRA